MIKALFHSYFEMVFWTAAMIALALSHPSAATHFTLCPLKLMGFNWCPGCGLGHSIAFLLHGDVPRSFHAHWLGIPALLMISYRIFTLLKQNIAPPRLNYSR